MMVRMDDPMWEKLRDFPREARKAWEKGHSFASELPEWDLDRIVLAGMGGFGHRGGLPGCPRRKALHHGEGVRYPL